MVFVSAPTTTYVGMESYTGVLYALVTLAVLVWAQTAYADTIKYYVEYPESGEVWVGFLTNTEYDVDAYTKAILQEGIETGLETWTYHNPTMIFEYTQDRYAADFEINFVERLVSSYYGTPLHVDGQACMDCLGHGFMDVKIQYNSRDVADVVAHEFGHILGFGHSKDITSIMDGGHLGGTSHIPSKLKDVAVPNKMSVGMVSLNRAAELARDLNERREAEKEERRSQNDIMNISNVPDIACKHDGFIVNAIHDLKYDYTTLHFNRDILLHKDWPHNVTVLLHTEDGPKTMRNGDQVEIFHQIYDTVDFDETLYTKYLVEIDLDDHIQGVFSSKTVYDMQIKIEGGTITLGRENQLNNGTILRTDTNTVWEDLYVDVQLVRETWDDYEGDNVQWLSHDDVPCDVSYYEPPFYDIPDLDIFYHGSTLYIVSNGNLSLNEGWYKNGMGLVTLKNTEDGSVPEYYIPIAVGSAEYNDKETRVGLTAPSFATVHFGFPYTQYLDGKGYPRMHVLEVAPNIFDTSTMQVGLWKFEGGKMLFSPCSECSDMWNTFLFSNKVWSYYMVSMDDLRY